MKIYLSGWVGEVDYRRHVLETYSKQFEVNDPLTEVEKKMNLDLEGYRAGIFDFSTNTIIDIVEGDLKLLNNCDVLVAMMNRYSAGTIMEIRAAYESDKPVYIIDPGKTMRRDIWLRYHTNVFFNTIEECFDFLKIYNENFCTHPSRRRD